MALMKNGHEGERKRRWRRKKKIAEHAERLAPPEEKGHAAAVSAALSNSSGSIIVDTGNLKLPKNVGEEAREGKRLLGLDPIVLALLVLSLLFITFITVLIARQRDAPEAAKPVKVVEADSRP